MSPLSGYSSDLPSEVLLNPALVYIGSTVWGVTRGGVEWDPEKEFAEIDFDGKRSHVKGLTLVNKFGGKMSFTLLQLGTPAEVQQLEGGATTATSTDTKISSIVTPKDAGLLLASGDYLSTVRAIWELGSGTSYFAILLPTVYVSKYTVKGGADGQGEIAVELIPCLDLSAGQVSDAPYKYELRSALP